jgi:hypothetical protein
MSINNIQLNPSLLVDMYRTSLVETEENLRPEGKKHTGAAVEAAANDAKAVSWKYLGEYKKNILIIVT